MALKSIIYPPAAAAKSLLIYRKPLARSGGLILSLYGHVYMASMWQGGKESTCNAGDTGLIPGLGRSPGGRNGTPL